MPVRGEGGGTGQREELSCNVVAKEASVRLSGCSEAGVTFQRCPKMKQEGGARGACEAALWRGVIWGKPAPFGQV